MSSSSSAQLRKIKKPLIERRRRERINDSLNQLKNLVLEATNKDESRYSKMEKADILEMTVAYLRAIHCRRRPDIVASSPSTADRYTVGYRECAVHVGQYLVDAGVGMGAVRDQLMLHLDKALQAAVDGCRQLTDVELVGDVDQSLWTGDCDETGRCSPDSDDDNSVVSGTNSDADVVRHEYVASSSTCAEPLTDTPVCANLPFSRVDADSPQQSADKFSPQAAFRPKSTSSVECSTPQTGDVIDDVIDDLVMSRDVRMMSLDATTCCNCITSTDVIVAESSDVWRPWR